jgi:hypothetical protein
VQESAATFPAPKGRAATAQANGLGPGQDHHPSKPNGARWARHGGAPARPVGAAVAETVLTSPGHWPALFQRAPLGRRQGLFQRAPLGRRQGPGLFQRAPLGRRQGLLQRPPWGEKAGPAPGAPGGQPDQGLNPCCTIMHGHLALRVGVAGPALALKHLVEFTGLLVPPVKLQALLQMSQGAAPVVVSQG